MTIYDTKQYRYVSEVFEKLPLDEIIKNNEIIFVSAGVGRGKTYGCKHIFEPYCDEHHISMYYVCNRKKLLQQSQAEFIAPVTTYQAFMMNSDQTQRMTWENVAEDSKKPFLVFDEIHYLFSDASFNDSTDDMMSYIINSDGKLPMVFMSGSGEHEFEFLKKHFKSKIHYIRMPDNYDHVRKVYYFSRELSERLIINYYISSNEKIVIFVNSLKEAVKLFHSVGCDFCFMMSEGRVIPYETLQNEESLQVWKEQQIEQISPTLKGKQRQKELERIEYLITCSFKFYETKKYWLPVKDEHGAVIGNQFNCPVLICTSVLDNGVNLKDKKITAIINGLYSPTNLYQAFGRVRFLGLTEHVTYFLKIPTEEQLAFKFNDHGDETLEDMKRWVKTKQQKSFIDYEYYHSIIEKRYEQNISYHKAYLDTIKEVLHMTPTECERLSHFESVERTIETYQKQKLKEFIETYRNEELDKATQEKLLAIINLNRTETRNKQHNSGKIKSISNVNDYLFKNFGVHVKPRRKQVNGIRETFWIIY